MSDLMKKFEDVLNANAALARAAFAERNNLGPADPLAREADLTEKLELLQAGLACCTWRDVDVFASNLALAVEQRKR